MSLISRAHQILRTHGIPGLLKRAAAKGRRYAMARASARGQKRAWDRFVAQVRVGPVFFPRHESPLVSVVIVASDARLLASCLNGVLRQLDSMPLEVIVAYHESSDAVSAYLNACSGIAVIRAEQDYAGLLESAVGAARGRYVHLLADDAIVTPGWVAPLLRTFESDPSIGIVGSQLRTPSGAVAHAGGIVWRDGTSTVYGAGEKPHACGVAFPRDVDVASSASLMVRADLLAACVAHAHATSSPHAFELELAFRARDDGYRVLYQPASIVIVSAGVPAHTNRDGARDIARDWLDTLATHFPADELLVERAARRLVGRKTVLVMDSFVPFYDRSAGARRMLAIMRIMRDAGWHVVFVAHDGGAYEPYTSRVRRLGIEVVPHRGDAHATLRSLPMPIDVAWIARPDVLQRYLPVLRAHVHAPIVYDTVDLHHVRRRREEEVLGVATQWQAMQSIELELARKVECTVVTSESEIVALARHGVVPSIVPIVEPRVEFRAPFSSRRDIVFLGNYSHEPNVDAARWLAEAIAPRVRERLPDVRIVLAGADPTPAVERLAQPGIDVVGYVEDLDSFLRAARVFVAPLRYGAGMKGKIVQSIAHGLPVVTTTVGAEGIGMENGRDALIRDDAAAFADAIVELYNDEARWKHLSDGACELARRYEPRAVAPAVDAVLAAALQQKERVGIDLGATASTA